MLVNLNITDSPVDPGQWIVYVEDPYVKDLFWAAGVEKTAPQNEDGLRALADSGWWVGVIRWGKQE